MPDNKILNQELSPIVLHAERLSLIALAIAAVVNPIILFGVLFLFGYPGHEFVSATITTEIIYAIVLLLLKKHQHYLGRLLFSFTLLSVVFAYSCMVGIDGGYQYYFFPIGAGSYLAWPTDRKHQISLTSAAFVIFMFISISAPSGLIDSSQWDKSLVHDLFLINCASSFLSCFAVLHTLAISSEKTQGILDMLEKKAEMKASFREDQMLRYLNALAKARDNETGNHIIRTQNYVKVLALGLRNKGIVNEELSDASIEELFKAAPLHDIGKIGIPDNILLKKGNLNDEEWIIMKTHALIGESVLSSSNNESELKSGVIDKAVKVAGGHHEKWDGSGYPRGLSGQNIPIEARIMTVADMYDALLSRRPYKNAWTHEDAVQEIVSKRGTHLDPTIVDVLLAEQDSFKEISLRFRD
jgi:HD-GYP domain-containing protein (c-di-GMP phosphodiesterase class II)